MLIYLRNFLPKHLTYETLFNNKTNCISLVKIDNRNLYLSHCKFKDDGFLENSNNSDANLDEPSKKQLKKNKAKSLRNFSFVSFENKKILVPPAHQTKLETSQNSNAPARKDTSENQVKILKNQLEESSLLKLAKLIDNVNPGNVEESLIKEPVKMANEKISNKIETRQVSKHFVKLDEILQQMKPIVNEKSKTTFQQSVTTNDQK
jgi:hypothetical protein